MDILTDRSDMNGTLISLWIGREVKFLLRMYVSNAPIRDCASVSILIHVAPNSLSYISINLRLIFLGKVHAQMTQMSRVIDGNKFYLYAATLIGRDFTGINMST